MALGAPSVMTSGTTEMPVWCADSWDSHHMVGCKEYIYICGLLNQVLFTYMLQVGRTAFYQKKIDQQPSIHMFNIHVMMM